MRVSKPPLRRKARRRVPAKRRCMVTLKLPCVHLEPQLLFSSPLRHSSPLAAAYLPSQPVADCNLSNYHIYTEDLLDEEFYEPGPLNWSLYGARGPDLFPLSDYPSSEHFPGSFHSQSRSQAVALSHCSTPKQAKVYTHLYPQYDTSSPSVGILDSSPLKDTFSYSDWFKAPGHSVHNNCQCLGCSEIASRPHQVLGMSSIDPRLLVKPSDIQTSEMTLPSDSIPSDHIPGDHCDLSGGLPDLLPDLLPGGLLPDDLFPSDLPEYKYSGVKKQRFRLKSARSRRAPNKLHTTPGKRSLKFVYTFMNVPESPSKNPQPAIYPHPVMDSSPIKGMYEQGNGKKVGLDNMVFYKDSGRPS